MPQFTGSIIFLENYDMSLAKRLVSGVDLWLNLPTRPLEASGTSGEKAVMNAVVNFSVLDGWWAEGYRPEAGWALPKEATYSDNSYQNALDAQMLYDIFLSEIIPAYYSQNQEGVSETWCNKMKSTIADILPHYTMTTITLNSIARCLNKQPCWKKTTPQKPVNMPFGNTE